MSDVLDLFALKASGKTGYNIFLSARLNGPPHIGTLINFVSGFILAKRVSDRFQKPSSVVVELLDNISDSKLGKNIIIDNKEYFYRDSVLSNKSYAKYQNKFIMLLDILAHISGVSYEIRNYENILMISRFRHCIIEVFLHKDFFSNIFHPSGGGLHVRTSCPQCGLLEKKATDTHIKQIAPTEFFITSKCPYHEEYGVFFASDNSSYIDINIAFRNFCRGLMLVDEDKANNTLSVILNGNDWSGLWPLRIYIEGILHLKRKTIPNFLFTPLVLENNSKLSKSNIEHDKLSASMYDVSMLGINQISNIWSEVWRWFYQPNHFFTNYDIKYFIEYVG